MAGIDTYTKLLIHCDGADASTLFYDASSSSHTISVNADTQVDVAQKKFGNASALFDGTGDNMNLADHVDWTLGTSDFVIDMQVRFSSVAAECGLMASYQDASNYWSLRWDDTEDLKFEVEIAGSVDVAISETWAPLVDTWYHVAVVKSSGSYYMFINGTQLGTEDADATEIPNFGGNLFVGTAYSQTLAANALMAGWLDEVRLSKGTDRGWTSNFSAPTVAYSHGSSGFLGLL